MDWWSAEAMDVIQHRVPDISDEHALELADALYEACPHLTPQRAVGWLFDLLPQDWAPKALDQKSTESDTICSA